MVRQIEIGNGCSFVFPVLVCVHDMSGVFPLETLTTLTLVPSHGGHTTSEINYANSEQHREASMVSYTAP